MEQEAQKGAMGGDLRKLVLEAVEEHARREAEQREPALKAELLEERRRREQLEKRLNEVVEDNSRHRKVAEEVERHATIRSLLQNLGVKKVELAFRAVKDEVFRGEDGQLYGRAEQGDVSLRQFLTRFIADNPELLPARIAGGSGASGGSRHELEGGAFDLSQIRPGMSAEERQRARREIARLAGKDFGGWL